MARCKVAVRALSEPIVVTQTGLSRMRAQIYRALRAQEANPSARVLVLAGRQWLHTAWQRIATRVWGHTDNKPVSRALRTDPHRIIDCGSAAASMLHPGRMRHNCCSDLRPASSRSPAALAMRQSLNERRHTCRCGLIRRGMPVRQQVRACG